MPAEDPRTIASFTALVAELPVKTPAIYAFYGRADRTSPAYVGMTTDLRSRINQHLVRRDSSRTTGASVVSLNPDLVVEVRWWHRADFADERVLRALRHDPHYP